MKKFQPTDEMFTHLELITDELNINWITDEDFFEWQKILRQWEERAIKIDTLIIMSKEKYFKAFDL